MMYGDRTDSDAGRPNVGQLDARVSSDGSPNGLKQVGTLCAHREM